MPKIFEALAEKIITKEELVDLIEQIEENRSRLFKNQTAFLNKKFDNQIGLVFIDYLEYLERKQLLPKNPREREIFFSQIIEYLKQLPQIKIEVGFKPKENFLKTLADWLKKVLKTKVVLNVIINPDIVGGAVIEYKGKILNVSLAKKIDEIFKL